VGVTFAPGKTGPSVLGDPWTRDLVTDLAVLKQVERVDVLISLIEDHELTLLQIESLPSMAVSAGLSFHHFSITDMQPPALALARQAAHLAATAARAGQRVVFHCRGGLGRAGTLAACTLIHFGYSAENAILRTRAIRPGAIETLPQEAFVRAYTA